VRILRAILTMVLVAVITIPVLTIAGKKNMEFNPAQRKAIEEIVRDYLVKNPEILVEVSQALQDEQEKQYEQMQQSTEKAAAANMKDLFQGVNDPVAGNVNGKITLVEFFDYQCAHCRNMDNVIKDLMAKNPDLRIVFKEFPVIGGEVSEYAAKVALAANEQGKYFPVYSGLIKAKMPLTKKGVLAIAKAAGANIPQIEKAIKSKAIQQQLEANKKLAQEMNLIITPAIIVGPTDANQNKSPAVFLGEASADDIEKAIKNTQN